MRRSWALNLSSLAVLTSVAGCAGGGGGGVTAADDLAGKSPGDAAGIVVEVVCETKCPSLGVACLAPEGCHADVIVEDRALCKQQGKLDATANLTCMPLADDEVEEANACLEELLARECPHTVAELQALADAYDGMNTPEYEEAPWPAKCERIGMLIWEPARPECVAVPMREGEGADLICVVMEECYPTGAPDSSCEVAVEGAGSEEELMHCADCLDALRCDQLGPIGEPGADTEWACAEPCDLGDQGSARTIVLEAREAGMP